MTSPSTNATALDCFATAIKHIIDAARIDPGCASIVPEFAVAFANIAKDPKAKSSLGVNIGQTTINEVPSPTPLTYLVESIRVLSFCAPLFGDKVSELIPLIISVMSSPSSPSGFASTEVGAETTMVTATQDSISTVNPESADVMKKVRDVAVLDDRKMPAEPCTTTGRSGPSSNQDDVKTVSKEVHLDTNTSQDGTDTMASRGSFIQDNLSDSVDSAMSSASKKSYTKGKRQNVSDDAQIIVPDRIPKRQKCMASKIHSDVIPPRNDRDSYYTSFSSNNQMMNDLGTENYRAMTDPGRNKVFGTIHRESADNTISLKDLRIRASYWSEVIKYKPTSRCIPIETYLVIAITCSGPDDSPTVLKKYEDKEEVVKDKDLKAFLSIKKILLIERPIGGGIMYYCIPNLHKWVHGTLHLKSKQDRYFKDATRHIQDIVTIRSGDHYKDNDLGIQIRYQDRNSWNEPCLRELLPYVADEMDPSSGTARQVPCISWGWSTANPNEYKNNRSNMLGSISPFLSDGGMRNLCQRDKDLMIDLVCHVVKMFSPNGIHPTPFYHSDPNIRKMREELACKFLQAVGTASHQVDEKYFIAEGVAFIFNNFVPFHVDQMNDTAAGMNETLAMNCLCLITSDLSSIPSIRKAMNLFNLKVGDPLSFSMVLYSRKVVGDFVKKQLRLQSVLDASTEVTTSNLPECWWLLKPLIRAILRVDSDVNSNAIWDDHSLLGDYMNKIQRDSNNTQYQGGYISMVRGFDPMRYWSPVRYMFDALHARKVICMTYYDALAFCTFASLETNGTFLLSGIVDDILSNRDTLFIEDYKKYGLYAALIFAGHRKNMTDIRESGTAYGLSHKPRLQYHGRGTNDSIPIAGGTGLVSLDTEEDKAKVKGACNCLLGNLASALDRMLKDRYNIVVNRQKGTIDEVARDFLYSIRNCAGVGISRDYAHNFLQVASLFGFIPYELICWSCIDDKTSDAYLAINSFYRNALGNRAIDDLSLAQADKHFKAAVKYLGSNINWNFTSAIAKNILCELYKEMDRTIVSPDQDQDIQYLFPHRNGAMNHLYRWKMDIKLGSAIQQVLIISNTNEIHGSYNLFEVTKTGSMGGRTKMEAMWTGGMVPPFGINPKGKYKLSEDYVKCFL
jgi:hypothetical protein